MLKLYHVDFETNKLVEKARQLCLEASFSLPESNKAKKIYKYCWQLKYWNGKQPLEDTVKYKDIKKSETGQIRGMSSYIGGWKGACVCVCTHTHICFHSEVIVEPLQTVRSQIVTGESSCHKTETSWTVDTPREKRGGMAESDPVNSMGYFLKSTQKHSDMCCPAKDHTPLRHTCNLWEDPI